MTPAILSEQWAAPVARVRHWCRRELIAATKRNGRWQITEGARPAWRDGRSMLALFLERQNTVAAIDVEGELHG